METDSHLLMDIVNIAQKLIAREQRDSAVTPTLIRDKVAIAASLFDSRAETVIPAATEELIRRFSLWIGKDTTLLDEVGHMPWLTAARRTGWRYWQRYQEALEKRMSVTAVDALDESTNHILGLLEDPHREGRWDRRGLVVGHVQSGKTGNYTGLVCKAADAGYKIIIVLAGLHNNLRSQTQVRLEEGFLGYETSPKGDSVRPIGVGLVDSDLEIRPNCATNRSNTGDFNTRVARHYAISPEQRPWLFVVKKNKTVLERLLRWIGNHVADTRTPDGRPVVTHLPLLLIDDEADHASVDTGEQLFNPDGTPDAEHEPKAINSRIRKILHSFTRKAYVGYTATPFANIFIHRRNETTDEGPDLFPQAFIINLAAPSSYVGPSRVFGFRTPEGRIGGLPLIRSIDDHGDAGAGWMPARHKIDHVPLHRGLDAVPPSLKEAIGAFVLSCAVRVIRGHGAEHASMLIHVTRFNRVQKEVHRQVSDLVKGMRQRIVRGIDNAVLLDEWRRLWNEDFLPTSAALASVDSNASRECDLPEWDRVLSVLPEVIADMDVRMINGSAKDALDYVDNEGKGLKVIAVGGDKLARGLTLEGLSTSYFVRTSKMYDTLMQMGRWFGYRPGYIDLCRLYTTDDLSEWFGHIADAAEELRQEFELMAKIGATPRDYGLKVQSHPVLLVTSPLKMRTAKSLQLSFSGELLETVIFFRDQPALEGNLAAAERLFVAAGAPAASGVITARRNDREKVWKGYLWQEVHFDHVVDFLSTYRTHPENRKVISALLVDYIRTMAAAGELTRWTVALIGGGDGASITLAGRFEIDGMSRRKPNDDGIERYSIGRLLSPPHEAIDLDEAGWSAAMELTLRDWNPDPGRTPDGVRPKPPDRPSGPAIRQIRGLGASGIPACPEKGLLLIYPLDPGEAGLPPECPPVIGFGISFPQSRNAVKVEYKVDHLTWENEYGAAD